MPPKSVEKGFTNTILCDDIRYEVGNKKSLIGVSAGDIIVGTLPANIQIAFYVLYETEPKIGDFKFKFTLFQGDQEMLSTNITSNELRNYNQLVIPRLLIPFEKECDIVLFATINDEGPTELLRRKVMEGETQPR